MTVRMTTFAVALSLGTTMVACGPVSRSVPATPEPHAAQPMTGASQPVGLAALAGRQWVLRQWGTDEPFAGTPVVTLSFADGRIAGRSGCNRYTGTASSGTGAGTLVLGPLAGTRMACPPAIMKTESRFLAALGRVDRWVLVPSGELALSYKSAEGADATLLFSEATTRRSD